MAVDPGQLDRIAAHVASIYRQADTELAELVASYLARGADSPEWANQRLAATRALLEAAERIVTRLSKESSGVFRDAALAAFRGGDTAALVDLAGWVDPDVWRRARQAVATELPGWGPVEAVAAAVQQDVGRAEQNILRDVDDAYRSVITSAVASTNITAGRTWRDAAQAAWQRLVDRGITGFTDSSGRRWSLPAYVEMATRTVGQRAAVAAHEDRLASMGHNLVYINGPEATCRRCRPFVGEVLSLAGPTGTVTVAHQLTGEPVEVQVVATVDEARARGLFHPNCEHTLSLYLSGVTTLPHKPEPDAEARFDASQRQRAIERNIRQWKQRQTAALTDEARKHAGRKVRAWQAEMRRHLDQHPTLRRLRHREQPGAGIIPSQRVLPAGELDPMPDPEPVTEQAPAELSDAELELAMQTALTEENFDRFELLAAESDTRQAAQQRREARNQRQRDTRRRRRERRGRERWLQYERLVEQGVAEEQAIEAAFGISPQRQRRNQARDALRDSGYQGSLDQMIRASYADQVERAYRAAEDDTRGHLLTRRGQTRGIDPADLWRATEATAAKWASDELKAWWDAHGRLTLPEWRAQLLAEPGTLGRIHERRRDFLA